MHVLPVEQLCRLAEAVLDPRSAFTGCFLGTSCAGPGGDAVLLGTGTLSAPLPLHSQQQQQLSLSRTEVARAIADSLASQRAPVHRPRGWKWAPHLSSLEDPSQAAEQRAVLSEALQQADTSSDVASLSVQGSHASTAVVDDTWLPFNESQLTPLLPSEIVWLLEDAQDRLRNRSSLPLQLDLARTLARYTSIVYCQEPNIMAWNCTR